MTYSLTWLPTVLRAAGLTVELENGWQTRGHGDVSIIQGVLCHHTAGGKSGNAPSLGVVMNGRPGLSGPLAQLVLGRDGTFFVVAAGLAYHAGAGYWHGITSGNSHMIGIEAENTGLPNDSPWPEVQMGAYVRGVAAILKHVGAAPIMCAGHKEYALPHGRKPDPSFDMDAFRARVAAVMNAVGPVEPPKPVPVEGEKWRVHGVAPDSLAFRDAPAGEQHGSLPEGTVVTKIGSSESWSHVVTPAGFKGWVASRFLVAA